MEEEEVTENVLQEERDLRKKTICNFPRGGRGMEINIVEYF
jgi:hypothetical protein